MRVRVIVAPETPEPEDETAVAPETKPKDKKPLKARVASLRPMPTMPKLSKKYIEFKSKFKSTAARANMVRRAITAVTGRFFRWQRSQRL